MVCGDEKSGMVLPIQPSKERTDAQGNVHPEPLNGLVNTVARFEVARLNRGQSLHHRVCMEYIDNNAYEITECPESKYDMWDCCVIALCCYGKQTDDRRAAERTNSQDAYSALLQKVWDRDCVDLRYTAPREWSRFPYLSEEEV